MGRAYAGPRAARRRRWPATSGCAGTTLGCPGVRICIVGAGAVGGLIGARLALAGHETSAVARGATLDALRAHGWRLEGGERAPVLASDEPADLGPQDLVVLAVKAPALPAVAPRIGPLLGADTVVMPAMNGVPWWFLAE